MQKCWEKTEAEVEILKEEPNSESIISTQGKLHTLRERERIRNSSWGLIQMMFVLGEGGESLNDLHSRLSDCPTAATAAVFILRSLNVWHKRKLWRLLPYSCCLADSWIEKKHRSDLQHNYYIFHIIYKRNLKNTIVFSALLNTERKWFIEFAK